MRHVANIIYVKQFKRLSHSFLEHSFIKCLMYARQGTGIADKNINKIIRYTTLMDLKD